MKAEQYAVVEKRFEYKGHECICIFNRYGFRCGYVSINKQVDFDDYENFEIVCHGGLSFSGKLPKAYKPQREYYLGFDCGHLGDGVDYGIAYQYGLLNTKEYLSIIYINEMLFNGGARSLDYVVKNCKKIVDQLERGARIMRKFSELPKHTREMMTHELGELIDEWLIEYSYAPSTAIGLYTHKEELAEKLYDCGFCNTDTRRAITEFAGKVIAHAERCYDDDIAKIVKAEVGNVLMEYKL